MCLSDDAPTQEVVLAMAWSGREVDVGEVSGTPSEEEPLFPMRLGRGQRMTVSSGLTLRDERDGHGRSTPGLLPLAGSLFPTAPLWPDLSCFLWEAAYNLTAAGWPRDLVQRAIVASPLSPWDAAFLKLHHERLALGGPFRWLEEKVGIARMLDGAHLSVLLILAGFSDFITLGLFAAGVLIGVGIRLSHGRLILERKFKLRGNGKPEDERLTAGSLEDVVFQDNYQPVRGSFAGVRQIVRTVRQLGSIQRWTPGDASAVYGLGRRCGALGALCKGLHGDGVPDVRFLNDGTRGTVFNPYIRSRRVITRGSGIFHGHTDWPVDLLSKPGVASISPRAWGHRTNPEGGGTGVSWRVETKSRAAGRVLQFISGGSLGCFFFCLPTLESPWWLTQVRRPPFGKRWVIIHPCDIHSMGKGKKWTHGIEDDLFLPTIVQVGEFSVERCTRTTTAPRTRPRPSPRFSWYRRASLQKRTRSSAPVRLKFKRKVSRQCSPSPRSEASMLRSREWMHACRSEARRWLR